MRWLNSSTVKQRPWATLTKPGEWFRREGRRVDQLREAHSFFDSIGAGAFAERARRELQANGEQVRKRTFETRDLTPQEMQIASLAGKG